MGLDMYLTAETRVSRSEYAKDGQEAMFYDVLKAIKFPKKLLNPEAREVVVSIDIGYWRKANAIHGWFVNNIQDGEDDCGRYYVLIEKLEELLALCKEVCLNKDKAAELLPPTDGFFFGNTKINDGYFKDIEHTIDILNKVLSHDKLDEYDFYYSSSW